MEESASAEIQEEANALIINVMKILKVKGKQTVQVEMKVKMEKLIEKQMLQ
jgi:hypothetical protein